MIKPAYATVAADILTTITENCTAMIDILGENDNCIMRQNCLESLLQIRDESVRCLNDLRRAVSYSESNIG